MLGAVGLAMMLLSWYAFFLGARVYTWGLYCFFGAVLCLVTVYFQTRGKTNAAPLFGVNAAAGKLLGSTSRQRLDTVRPMSFAQLRACLK